VFLITKVTQYGCKSDI